MNKTKMFFLRYCSGFVALTVSASSFAVAAAPTAINVTGVTSQIGMGAAAVASIGGAILLVWGIKKVYSMISGK